MRTATRRWLWGVVIPLGLVSGWLMFDDRAPAGDQVQQAARAHDAARAATEKLARELEAQPDNPAGWFALARAWGTLGRWDAAASAIGHIGPTLDARADWLAAAAEIEFHRNGQRFTASSRHYTERALGLDPRHAHALTLAASDAMQMKRPQEAQVLWNRLLDILPPDSADAAAIRQALEQARTAAIPR